MRILFVHQNFPGQYRHIAPAVAKRPGNEVVALTMSNNAVAGVRNVQYALARGSTPGIHPFAGDFESKVIRGHSAARAASALRAEGFVPDIICGHPGWGETLFLKDVWPAAPILSFVEFVYQNSGADVGFDPEFPVDDEERFRVRSKNASVFLSLADSDWLVSPTAWQARQVPAEYRSRLSVIHDGIDTDLVAPNPGAKLSLARERIELKPGDEVVTFVNRNLEPYRGYHTFMRALPDILRKRPRARAILVGGTGVSYGSALSDGRTYKDKYLEEVKSELDMSRVHFVGTVAYPLFLSILQVSAVHVYLTYPFVLSWSLLEAMAAGCVVVGSATQPVEEVICDGETGRLVDFLSPQEISSTVIDVLARPRAHVPMRQAARQTIVSKYDLRRTCLPQHLRLVEQVAASVWPSGTTL